MKWSKSYIYTLKEAPADAEVPSHKLMLRAGYIRKLAQGIFTYGPLAVRALRKFETIVREELNKSGAIEVLMPMVQPKELWQETNRWTEMGAGLLKFENRTGQEFCLGATHEEVITDFVRKDLKSYRDLPFCLYQIQTKYRDEIRPRFGLLRGREFIMKDAYSFDASEEAALESYAKMHAAYTKIFSRLGANFRVVDADSGNIGGNKSQEFHILADSGEDHLLVSDQGDFAANVEVCPANDAQPRKTSEAPLPLEKFSTPGLKTIADLARFTKIGESELVKTMFFETQEDPGKASKPVAVLLRGSDEVNPIKLKNVLGMSNPPELLGDEQVLSITGASPGSCGPVGLNIPIYMDRGVEGQTNLVVGANENDFHLKNVNVGRDFDVVQVDDIRMAKAGDLSPNGKGRLESYRGIEVGHIFYLGTKYSKAMQAQFLNAQGEQIPVVMGCYGIGVSRTIQAVIEQCHDKDGIIWPLAIAPYAVHICLLDPKDEKASVLAEEIYQGIHSAGYECLMDDRDERPGVKFKDADLLGMPYRLTIGGRGVAQGEIEFTDRKTKEQTKLPTGSALEAILKVLNNVSGVEKK